jgi:hypothetical protein
MRPTKDTRYVGRSDLDGQRMWELIAAHFDEATEFALRSAHTDIALGDPRRAEETDESMRSGHSAFSIGRERG